MRSASLIALSICLACGGMDEPTCTLVDDSMWELTAREPGGVCAGLDVGDFIMTVTATGAVGRPAVFDVCSGVPETTSRAPNFVEVDRVCLIPFQTNITFTLQCETSDRGRGQLVYVERNALGQVGRGCRLGFLAVRVDS